MDHLEGVDQTGSVQLSFDRRVRLEFHGPKISSDGGLIQFRELDEVFSLHELAHQDWRKGRPPHPCHHMRVRPTGTHVADCAPGEADKR